MDQESRYAWHEGLPLEPGDTTFRGRSLPPGIAHLKYWVDVLRGAFVSFRAVLRALTQFEKTGVALKEDLHDLQDLFCRTRGLSNFWLHRYLTYRKKHYFFTSVQGLVADKPDDIQIAVKHLKQEGYYIFPKRLPESLVEHLVTLAGETQCYSSSVPENPAILPSEAARDPKGPVYRYREDQLVAQEAIQTFMADTSVLQVAQSYLGCPPILDLVHEWWSFPIEGTPPIDAAQMYHFDMDRIRWLTFFIYLTDVTTESGPHCFIKGSHKNLSQPWELLRYGYHRHSDQSLQKYYDAEQFTEITGPKGTVFVEDTRGFHKGMPVIRGQRLVLELEFAGSLFGAPFERPLIRLVPNSPLAQAAKKFPEIYQKYRLEK